MNRQVLLLVTAQAFAQTASILVMTVGSLAGRELMTELSTTRLLWIGAAFVRSASIEDLPQTPQLDDV